MSLIRRPEHIYPPKQIYQEVLITIQNNKPLFDKYIRDEIVNRGEEEISLSDYITDYRNRPYYIIQRIMEISAFNGNSIRLRYQRDSPHLSVVFKARIRSYLETNDKFVDQICDNQLWQFYMEEHPEYNDLKKFWDYGYQFYQYYVVNPDNVFVAAALGHIELNPTNFEKVTTLPLNQYEEVISDIGEIPARKFPVSRHKKNIYSEQHKKVYSFSKRSLMDAIKKLGTEYPTINYRPMYSKDTQIKSSPTTKKITLGQIKINVDPMDADYPLPGFQRYPYMPRRYYEAIYRHLYKTISVYNWNSILANPQIKIEIEVLLFIALYDFNIAYNRLVNSNRNEIIEVMIGKLKYREMKPKVGEISQLSEEIIYQPASLWVEPVIGTFIRQPESLHRIEYQYQQQLIDEVELLCKNAEQLNTRHKLMQIVRGLDLQQFIERERSIDQITNNQLCQFILKYLKSLARTSRQ